MDVDKEFLNFRINYSFISINPKQSEGRVPECYEELVNLFKLVSDYPLFLGRTPVSLFGSASFREVEVGLCYYFPKGPPGYLPFVPALMDSSRLIKDIKSDPTSWTLDRIHIEYSFVEEEFLFKLFVFNNSIYKEVEGMTKHTFVRFINEIKTHLGDRNRL